MLSYRTGFSLSLLAVLFCGFLSGCTSVEEDAKAIMVLKKPLPNYSLCSGSVFGMRTVSYETSAKDKSISFYIKPVEPPVAGDKRRLVEEIEKKKAELEKTKIRSEGTIAVAGRTLRYKVKSLSPANGEELEGTLEPVRNNSVVSISCHSDGKVDLQEVKELLACVDDFKD